MGFGNLEELAGEGGWLARLSICCGDVGWCWHGESNVVERKNKIEKGDSVTACTFYEDELVL